MLEELLARALRAEIDDQLRRQRLAADAAATVAPPPAAGHSTGRSPVGWLRRFVSP